MGKKAQSKKSSNRIEFVGETSKIGFVRNGVSIQGDPDALRRPDGRLMPNPKKFPKCAAMVAEFLKSIDREQSEHNPARWKIRDVKWWIAGRCGWFFDDQTIRKHIRLNGCISAGWGGYFMHKPKTGES